MLEFTPAEQAIASVIKQLKAQAGSHAPSLSTIMERVPQLTVQVDACFLSNPYAADLFFQSVTQELIVTNKIRAVLASYPSQNRVIAEVVAPHLQVSAENVFIGNGATEIIQAILHRLPAKKILVTLPTFSPYYEFPTDGTEVVYHPLDKRKDFRLDTAAYMQRVEREKPEMIVLINPNNPDGGYIDRTTLVSLLDRFRWVKHVIVDESFIHFVREDEQYALQHSMPMIAEFENLIIIKSMSKDFGLAGIRAGFAVMAKKHVTQLLKHGYLWNVSGLAEFFFRLYVREPFQQEYEKARRRYIQETQQFFAALATLPGLKVYPSQANFALVEVTTGMTASEFVLHLLIQHGIYVRDCSDKVGLEGEFVRIASRTQAENLMMLTALSALLDSSTSLPDRGPFGGTRQVGNGGARNVLG